MMTPTQRPRIALLDYAVNTSTPNGTCYLRLLEGLHDTYDFTVFSAAIDNPDPATIRWERVPVIRRPLVALFSSFYVASLLRYRRAERRGRAFDLVQIVEGNAPLGEITYVKFCHRAFLKKHWKETRPPGLRGVLRKIDHRFRAAGEKRAFARARWLVVPTSDLAADIREEYPGAAAKIRMIPNPVDIGDMTPPEGFSRDQVRDELGFTPDDVVSVFVALGHFERKGLPELMEALRTTAPSHKLLVVGGEPRLVEEYRNRATRMAIADRVAFVGRQGDVRPYLWSADVFTFPSAYEVFSLAMLQAAAAGLPLLVTEISGVNEFFEPGVHGLAITRDPGDIASALTKIGDLSPDARRAMGRAVQEAIEQFSVPAYVERWREMYAEALPAVRSER